MAEIKPIRPWRYNEELGKKIHELISPLFDVISSEQRKVLYSNPNNSIHISVPLGENPLISAKETLDQWKKKGIIQRDDLPGIYVYYQYFTLPGSDKEYCRKGIICNIKAYDWNENIILRHENVMPYLVNGRAKILSITKMNVSATHGLFTDENDTIEKYMDESMLCPIYSTEDYQGVLNKLSVIHDNKVINSIVEILQDKQVILADGHHRYEGSLVYKHKCINENPNHTGNEMYNYHMMYLTNTQSESLRILPTHRLINDILNFNTENFLNKLKENFNIQPIPNVVDLNEIILGKKRTFGLIIGEEAYKIELKKNKWQEIKWNLPDEVKKLDLTVMHYYILERIFGIMRDDQIGSDKIGLDKIIFEKNFTICMNKVLKKEAQLALITNEISMETVRKVCHLGVYMPQKSTYFYPKTVCGYLFESIDEDE